MNHVHSDANPGDAFRMYILYTDGNRLPEADRDHYQGLCFDPAVKSPLFAGKQGSYGHLQGIYEVYSQEEKPGYYGFCNTRQSLCLYENDCEMKKSTGNDDDYGLYKNTEADCFRYDPRYLNWIFRDHVFICPETSSVRDLGCGSVMEYLLKDFYHFDQEILMKMVKIIHYRYPAVRPFADGYLNGPEILRQHIWLAGSEEADAYIAFLFDILFNLEQETDLSHSGREHKKLFECLASHLLAIYCSWLEGTGKKVKRVKGMLTYGKTFEAPTPAYPENNICLVFSSSNDFAPYLGVALKSLMSFVSPQNNYDILVLEKKIEKQEKDTIRAICSGKPNVSVRFINLQAVTSDIHFYVPTADLSEETYYTVLVPWVLSSYEKALVLDCDLLFNHDPAELFNTDIGDFYIAAIKEIVFLGFLNNPRLNVNNSLTDYVRYKLEMKEPYQYFNAGVLLINLEAFRRVFTMEELIGKINVNKYSIVEQDLLNSVCAGHVKWMDYKWNLTCVLTRPEMFPECTDPSSMTVPNLELAPEEELDKWKEAFAEPYIYHYLTKYKPWDYPFLEYADLWWKAAKETPYYERFIYNLVQKGVANRGSAAVTGEAAGTGYTDSRTGTRKFLDKVFPVGSKRRTFAHIFVPKGSRRSRALKKILRAIVPLK